MDELGLTDNVAAIGDKKKDCKVDSVAEKMEKKDGEDKAQVVYGGKEEKPDFKTLVNRKQILHYLHLIFFQERRISQTLKKIKTIRTLRIKIKNLMRKRMINQIKNQRRNLKTNLKNRKN